MTRRKDGVTCSAKSKSTGVRCGNPPLVGGSVCRIHGGGAPQVKEAAARRVLEALVAPALIQLRRIVDDPSVVDPVKLAAVRDILDRTGYKPPTQVEVVTMDAVEKAISELEQELAFNDPS